MWRIGARALAMLLLAILCLHAEAQTLAQTCVEDGGTAECVAPNLGPWIFSGVVEGFQYGIYSWNKRSAAEVIADIDQQMLAYFCTVQNDTPRFGWPFFSYGFPVHYQGGVSFAGSTYWTASFQPQHQACAFVATPSWISIGFDVQREPACPFGWAAFAQTARGWCYRPAKPEACCMGNPVQPDSGAKTAVEVDYGGSEGTRLEIKRVYSSMPARVAVGAVVGPGGAGAGWRLSYDHWVRVYVGSSTSSAVVYLGNNDYRKFTLSGGFWTPRTDKPERLIEQKDGIGARIGWQYRTADDEVEQFDGNGKLLSIVDRTGYARTFSYSTAATPASVAPGPDYLLSVSDTYGRSVAFSYDGLGRLKTSIDPSGGVYSYGYDTDDNLTSVQYPDLALKQYLYELTDSRRNLLTGIVDEKGSRYATYTYGVSGRLTSEHHAGGADAMQLTYPSSTVTTIVDALGTSRQYNFVVVNRISKDAGISEPCPACGVNSSAIAYDANGNVASRTNFNGKKVCYAYDLNRNLETSRVEGALSGEACSTVQATLPSRADVRKITTQWHANWRLAVRVAEPNRLTTLSYNGDAGHFCAPSGARVNGISIGVLCTKTIQATTDPTGQQGLAAATTGAPRVWRYTYDANGHVLTAADPNNRATTTTYYAASDANPGKRGNVRTITNPAGHVTTVTAYDASSRPLSITDPNGLITTLTYDARGRLSSRKAGVETMSYAYDAIGQLTRVTQPDGSYIEYAYDDAHRLTQIADGLGNRIVYTLDAMGNRIAEQSYDPANNLARARSRTYDALNRLRQDLGAEGQATSFTYDSNGNLASATDPLNHQTVNAYDALDRLVQVLDPGLGATTYAYDAANNLTRVTDPRGNATAYTYDGLRNLTRQASPDTGTTTSTYDAAGNLLTRTDARGASATFTYDALSRATKIVYAKSGSPNEVHSFSYDSGANAKGRLTQVVDMAGTTNWTYNSQGRAATKAQKIGGITQTLSYGYNAAGQLATLSTPSGQKIALTYANNRISSITINGQKLLDAVIVQPFGPIAAWHWGNGLFTFRDYDSDGRLATWEFRDGVSILRKDQTFDAAGRITGIDDPNNPAASGAYQYDALDRLTVAQAGNPVASTQQFGYDALGNRLSKTVDGSLTNYAYTATSNQLLALTGAMSRHYVYDGAGNPIAIGGLSYIYNNANRLAAVKNGATTVASYLVNALGQRVQKTVGTTTTRFVYDEQGHLLGEYDGSGKLVQETVWLEDLPVATLRPTGAAGTPTPIAVYYVHADHLGSPRAVTRPADNAIMWRWDNLDPFGANAANENPAGQGAFRYNLRFPGQYYDAETGNHYNYHRDYDPSIGRYVESDPIGLFGGINTYLYVRNPLNEFDPIGLARPDVPKFDWGYGCGNRKYGPFIPDNPLFFPFRDCCRAHDKCYDDCENRPTKQDCDQTFCSCLTRKCQLNPGMCTTLANYYCKKGTKSPESEASFSDSRRKCNSPQACVSPGPGPA